jgi:hypothetical protein
MKAPLASCALASLAITLTFATASCGAAGASQTAATSAHSAADWSDRGQPYAACANNRNLLVSLTLVREVTR